jgi:CheY-like chemotaxis protein
MAERTISGRYELDRVLAEGGMGTVWVARDLQLRRPVAIKLLRKSAAARLPPGQFEREAHVVAQLHHPNVVQVFDFGVADAEPYFVMELLEGEDLHHRIQHRGKLPLSEVARIIHAIARGLSAAHASGFVHRDIKPGNVFLHSRHGEEIPKLLDFGVAVGAFAPGEDADMLVGTPEYMSPEQARGEQASARSDVWALAAVAYKALTGGSPFTASEGLTSLLRAIEESSFAPVRQAAPELPAEIEDFFARGLAKDPSKRFRTVDELAASLMAVSEAAADATITVLVVDDEPDVELLMKQLFRSAIRRKEIVLHFAQDGYEGLEKLRQHADIGVILSDINMPRMDGLTFLGQLPEVSTDARAVMVSAYGDLGNIRKAMNLGAFDFVTKPFDFADLQTTIAKTARQAAQNRQAARARREVDLLRSALGPGFADQLLRLQHDGPGGVEEVGGTILAFRLASTGSEGVVEPRLLSVACEVVSREIHVRGGLAMQFDGTLGVAHFSGHLHVRRAATAGLAIARALREGAEGIEAALGLTSGSVTVLRAGTDSGTASRILAVGEAVRIALSLARRADLGELLAGSDESAYLDEGFELGPVRSEPMTAGVRRVYRVTLAQPPESSAPTCAPGSRLADIDTVQLDTKVAVRDGEPQR